MRTVKAALLAAALAVAAYAQDAPVRGPRELRVMSYNIKHGATNAACTQAPPTAGEPARADCRLNLQAAARVVRANSPDIIGMQEVDRFWARSDHVDQPAAIAAALGMDHYCYGANLEHPPDGHSARSHQYGTLILSRFAFGECRNTLLPRVGSSETRGLLQVLIDVRGVPVQFYTTHLHVQPADRLLQTAQIAALLDSAPRGPKVLVGDLNAPSTFATTVPEMVPIYSRLLDAWREAPVAAPGNPDGFTSPAALAGSPTARIDYVFVSPDLTVAGARVPIDPHTRLAADHYPVVSDLVLPGPNGDARPKRPTVPHVAGR